jgi:ligand-binding SRPBCC domain-containing protein
VKQILPITVEMAWGFFSDPKNLAVITPPSMRMSISKSSLGAMYEGMQISYRMSPLFGIPLNWTAEMKEIKAGKSFIDEQIKGPYKYWRHQHIFTPAEENSVIVEDFLQYAMPLGWAGRAVHRLIVHKKLKETFQYRRKKLVELFG